MNTVRRVLVVGVVAMVLLSGSAQASEMQVIDPGQANWHRYRFFVFTAGVAVRQNVTVQWDNVGTGMLLAIYETSDPAAPSLIAISSGNDRHVSLDIGLTDGTYQLVVAAVVSPTQYHLNVTYGSDEFLFQQPNGPLAVPSDLFTDRLTGEQLAPHLARLTAALER